MKEKDLIKKCRDYVHALGGIVHKDANGPFGERGWPDLTIILPNGTVLFCETKRKGERPNENQDLQLKRLQNAKALAFWTDDFDDFKAVVDIYRKAT